MIRDKVNFVLQLRRTTHEDATIRRDAHDKLHELWEQDKPLFDKLRSDMTAEYHAYPRSKQH